MIISAAIASFATNLPEIGELVGNQPKYAGSFKVSYNHNDHLNMLIIIYGFLFRSGVALHWRDFSSSLNSFRFLFVGWGVVDFFFFFSLIKKSFLQFQLFFYIPQFFNFLISQCQCFLIVLFFKQILLWLFINSILHKPELEGQYLESRAVV